MEMQISNPKTPVEKCSSEAVGGYKCWLAAASEYEGTHVFTRYLESGSLSTFVTRQIAIYDNK